MARRTNLTRRKLFGRFAGGAAVAVAPLVLPGPAAADNGDPVLLGQENTATQPTRIDTTGVGPTSGVPTLVCVSSAEEPSNGTAISGSGSVGVSGFGRSLGVIGDASSESGVGVHGSSAGTLDRTASGVHGVSSLGRGVSGHSSQGISIHAMWEPTELAALKVDGRMLYAWSGLATIPAGMNKITVTNATLRAGSLVLATMQNVVGSIAVRAAVPNVASNSFTVHLTGAPKPGQSAMVAWFIVN